MKSQTNHFANLFVKLWLTIAVIGLLNINTFAIRRTVYDFTGDNRTDFTTLSNASATAPLVWKFLRNPADPAPGAAFIRVFNHGIGSDSILPGDFIGDGKFEPTVWRAGTYYVSPFPETSVGPITYYPWGQTNDVVARDGDYDGDGKDDPTIIRTVNGQFQWWIRGSAGINYVTTFGGVLAAGFSIFRFQGVDFTGDAREELVIAAVNTTTFQVTWYVGDSITGAQIMQVNWGNFNLDFIIQPDDYTGDGKADLVVWRVAAPNAADRVWYIFDPATGAQAAPIGLQFGIGDPQFKVNDLPLRGDYDGDNIADIAVFRRSTRQWFWRSSSNGSLGVQQWGDAGDTALPTFFVF
jgi:hypothetical protein